VVLLAETKSSQSDDLDVRRVLFDRLNTGGIKLNPQELRNALYPGSLNDLLIRVARSDVFTSTWEIPPKTPNEEKEPSERLLGNALFASLADAELVLRVLGLRDALLHKKRGSLRRILDNFMSANVNISQVEVDEYEALFLDCLARLREVFAVDAFRLPSTGRLSRPLYDALMIALSFDRKNPIEERKPAIRAALAESLKKAEEYEILVGRGNTIDAIQGRVDLAGKILNAGR
jgi:hypothetical protein